MHRYRSHTCGALRASDIGNEVRLSGWCHRIRDHGGVLFIDLRDHYGLTQVVADPDSPAFKLAETLRSEWVVRIDGKVRRRPDGTENPDLPTGAVEVYIREIEVLGRAAELPMPVFGEHDYPEEIRLKYRFLDLRREHLHRNIMKRGEIIDSLRRRMKAQGFFEFQTPILTASSPEGARDYLVPSRLHPGKFYALPQAPQQFKQLIMISGFDRYFQIAPCFRDEDARADRSPGEFYQLDLEMSFVTQEDVFDAVEPVIRGVFEEFGGGKPVTPKFPRIPYGEALAKYGTDKPDLRNPIVMQDVSDIFRGSGFKIFRPNPGGKSQSGGVGNSGAARRLACLLRPHEFLGARRRAARPRLYFLCPRRRHGGRPRAGRQQSGPGAHREAARAAWLEGRRRRVLCCRRAASLRQIRGHGANESRRGPQPDRPRTVSNCAGSSIFRCTSGTRRRRRSTSPTTRSRCRTWPPKNFWRSMPADRDKILSLKAIQYDIVCNGVELSSGAIRNHRPDVMKKAFAIAGYDESVLEQKFGGMLHALSLGAPPHGGIAPGIDRIVMLLCGEENLREVVLFPMNQRAEDLMMGAPSEATPKQLRELHIRVVKPGPA